MTVDPTTIVNSALSATKKGATVSSTTTPAPSTTARPKLTWQEAKARRESARATVGYDKSSPIYGKTTLEVCQMLQAVLDDASLSEAGRILSAKTYVTELQKREAAQKLAFA